MTVGKDTIQTLLRQRQALRQALQELQKDIASLNVTAGDLVASNIKTPQKAASVAKPAEPEKTADQMLGKPEAKQVELSDEAKPSRGSADMAKGKEEKKAPTSSRHKLTARSLAIPAVAKDTGSETSSSDSSLQQDDVSDETYRLLLQEAKYLSSYYLRHPLPGEKLPLQQLDDAILAAEDKAAKGARSSKYQTLRNAYRDVAGPSFSTIGINGKTLEDSRISAHILWALPISICALVLVIFPLLLLGRTVSLEMFTSDFASDLIWAFGVAAAFLWGAAGALTSLSIQIALLVKNRRYEADIRRSPGIRAALGGILGSGIYALLEIGLPHSDISIEFFLNLGSFAIGLVAWVVFLSIQKGLGKLIRLFDPDTVPSAVKLKGEK